MGERLSRCAVCALHGKTTASPAAAVQLAAALCTVQLRHWRLGVTMCQKKRRQQLHVQNILEPKPQTLSTATGLHAYAYKAHSRCVLFFFCLRGKYFLPNQEAVTHLTGAEFERVNFLKAGDAM